MIVNLDPSENETAKRILNVSLEAYRKEAKLLRVKDFPPLTESLDGLKENRNTFTGFCINGDLAGVIEVESSGNRFIIARLVVSPAYVRQAVASKLLSHSLKKPGTYLVATAADNEPAISLYRKHGFVEIHRERIENPEISLVTLRWSGR